MLYISTDYVFDGQNPPYHHDSPTNPLNDYGISKLDGEKVVLNLNQGIMFKMTKTFRIHTEGHFMPKIAQF